jgi:hypothetical protein
MSDESPLSEVEPETVRLGRFLVDALLAGGHDPVAGK